jgi:hypothetical protein
VTRRLFLAAVLLVPCLAYAANPSATLKGKIVPAGAAPTAEHPAADRGHVRAAAARRRVRGIACDVGSNFTGTIPAYVQSAGFIHCNYNVDFSQPFYANLSNWLNCNPTGAFSIPNPQFHASAWPGFGANLSPTCADNFVSRQIDPATGTPALKITFQDNYRRNGKKKFSQIGTLNSDGHGYRVPSDAYFEVIARYDTPGPNRLVALWSFNLDHGIEFDGIEAYGYDPRGTGSASTEHNHQSTNRQIFQCANNCTANACPTCAGDAFPSGIDMASGYHSYAWRVTSDGKTDIRWCIYIDGQALGCDTTLPTADQLSGFGNQILLLSSGDSCNGKCSLGVPVNLWVRNVRIFSCDAVNSGAKCFTRSPNP